MWPYVGEPASQAPPAEMAFQPPVADEGVATLSGRAVEGAKTSPIPRRPFPRYPGGRRAKVGTLSRMKKRHGYCKVESSRNVPRGTFRSRGARFEAHPRRAQCPLHWAPHSPQQYASQSMLMPQVWSTPAEREAQESSELTAVGTFASFPSPVPSLPR